jgi:hypothetical protein
MASTYTVNIGIEKPGTGDQSGTWGTTTNTNFDIIDQATNGVATVTLAAAGTSGSPNTLQINNGALSDGRNRFIEFNDGADLGATAYVQLDPNDAEKIVHIRNSLSASRSLILFQGTYNASNDFEVPNGADVLVKFDGGGASATVTDVNANLTPTKITTSDVDINGGTIDGVTLGTNSAVTEAQVDNININGNTISSTDTNGNITLAPNGTGVVALSSTDLTFGDNDKAIFGAGSDLQIYHQTTGTVGSYISDQGAGPLNLLSGGVRLKDTTDTTTMFAANAGGSVTLYYNNAPKLATTSTGVDVTGTVTADEIGLGRTPDNWQSTYVPLSIGQGFNVFARTNEEEQGGFAANCYFDDSTSTWKRIGAGYAYRTFTDGGSGGGPLRVLDAGTGSAGDTLTFTERLNVARGTGDISFYDDTGTNPSFVYDASSSLIVNEDSRDFDFRVESNNNTHMFFVDGGTNRVGIGTSTVDEILHVEQASGTTVVKTEVASGSVVGFEIEKTGATNQRWRIADGILANGQLEIYDQTNSRSIFNADSTEIVINESSANLDFRVESDTNTHALFVDAGANKVSLGTSSQPQNFTVLGQGGAAYDVAGFYRDYTGAGAATAYIYIGRKDVSGNLVDGVRIAGGGDNAAAATHAGYFDLAIKDGAGGYKTLIGSQNAGASLVVNEQGNDMDFRVESDTSTHVFFVNASASRIGLFESNPQQGVSLGGGNIFEYRTGSQTMYRPSGNDNDHRIVALSNLGLDVVWGGATTTSMQRWRNGQEVVFNEDSANQDFRVESDTNAHAIFVDAGSNAVGFFNSNPAGGGFGSSGIIQQKVDQDAPTRFLVKNDNAGSSASSEVVLNAAGNSWVLGCGSSAKNSNSFTMALDGTAATPTLKLTLTTAGNLTAVGTIGGVGSYTNTTASAANVHILASGVLVRSTSSQKYKNTINDATHGLTELLALRPVTYKGNNDGDTIFGGLIAEEVHDAGLTEFVQYNDDGEPEALAYGNMVSLCIKAIQEQQTTITALEARIAALEAN